MYMQYVATYIDIRSLGTYGKICSTSVRHCHSLFLSTTHDCCCDKQLYTLMQTLGISFASSHKVSVVAINEVPTIIPYFLNFF